MKICCVKPPRVVRFFLKLIAGRRKKNGKKAVA